MSLPPVTPNLGLYLPAFDYPDWNTVVNDNWTAIDTFAGTVVLLTPTGNQAVIQPTGTFFSMNNAVVYGAPSVLRFGVTATGWDSALTRTAAGVFSLDTNTVGNGLATLNLGVANANTGFQVGGAAPSGHVLIGNGTEYVDSATIPTAAANYQIVQQAGTSVTQRNKLNFLAPLTAVDDSGNGSTDVGVAASGATAGTYTKPTMTVTAKGIVSSIANGAGVTATVNDVTSARTFGGIYQNTSPNAIFVSGFGNSTVGSAVANLTVFIGPTSSPATSVWQMEFGATVAAGPCGFGFIVPASWYYQINASGDVSKTGSSKFFETVLS